MHTFLNSSARHKTSITGRRSNHEPSSLDKAPPLGNRTKLLVYSTCFGGICALSTAKDLVALFESGSFAIGEFRGDGEDDA